MQLDNGSQNLIDIFEKEGFTAYAVGGCVRDTLMGRPVSDYDIAVPCTPDVTETILSKNDIRYIETGLKHGTVTAIINSQPYEITTFRTESGYSDNRRPDTVTFVTNITDDLARRDFTVNAMAYNPRHGLVDEFGGRHDLKSKTLRTVGDADTRFGEDALRILRALRFASTLEFEVEYKTAVSAIKNAPSLLNVAPERITVELQKLVNGNAFIPVLNRFSPALSVILPSVLKISKKQALDTLLILMQKLPHSLEFFLAACAIVAYGEKSEIHASDSEVFGHTTPSNQLKNKVKSLIEGYYFELLPNEACIKKLLSVFEPETLNDIITLKLAFTSDSASLLQTRRLLNGIVIDRQPYLVSHLAINGADVIALGFEGKRVGELLDIALDAVIDNPNLNTKPYLIDFLKKLN